MTEHLCERAGNSAPGDLDRAAEHTDRVNLRAAVRDLFDGMAEQPWGQTSPSVYETGRLVTLAPWLTGHAERVRWIVDGQRPDGCWGAPDGYALVPTLSAVEALLTTLHRMDTAGVPRIVDAVERGLRALTGLVAGLPEVPDTPAADLLVPALVGRINDHLDRIGVQLRLPLPAGMSPRRLLGVRRLLGTGAPVPEKLLHAFEAVADVVRRPPGAPPGGVGASPAATAAWVNGTGPSEYLDAVARRYGGPVPCATPIAVFERAWVLSALTRVNLPFQAPTTMVRELAAALGPDGTSAGPGLPADADTTAVALHALALLGRPADPTCLRAFRVGPHFCTWPGEDGVSVTTNAHVLDALGMYPDTSETTAGPLVNWLCDHQTADGAWIDRWHASLYYATSCCVLALNQFVQQPRVRGAVDRAVEWVLDTQRPDGSWGRWSGTAEETAYAMHVLLGSGRPRGVRVRRAAARGCAFLWETRVEHGPALWHDKDLYRPTAIVRAFTIAALYLGRDYHAA